MTTRTPRGRLHRVGQSAKGLREDPAIQAELFSQGFSALVIKVLGAALSFLMFVGIARSLDEVGFGIVGTVFSLATIAAAFGSMGQRVTAVRLVASYDEQDRTSERRGIMRFSYVVLTIGTIVAGFLAALWAQRSSDLPGSPSFLIAIVVLAAALGVSDLQTRVLRPVAGIALTLIPKDVLWRAAVVLFGFAVVLFWPVGSVSPTSWIWILSASLAALTISQMVFFVRSTPELSPLRGDAVYQLRAWSAESLAPWITVIVLTAGPSFAVVLVGAEVSIAVSGPFFAAVRVAQLLTLFMHAIEVVLSPNISRDFVSGRFGAMQQSCRTSAMLGAAFALFGWLVFVVAGGPILNLFRDGFGSQHATLVVLSLGYLINAAAGPTAPLLLMSGRASSLARYQLVAWAVGLVALVPAIRLFGTVGAAFSLATADVAWNMAARRLIKKEMRIEPTILSVFASSVPSNERTNSGLSDD